MGLERRSPIRPTPWWLCSASHRQQPIFELQTALLRGVVRELDRLPPHLTGTDLVLALQQQDAFRLQHPGAFAQTLTNQLMTRLPRHHIIGSIPDVWIRRGAVQLVRRVENHYIKPVV